MCWESEYLDVQRRDNSEKALESFENGLTRGCGSSREWGAHGCRRATLRRELSTRSSDDEDTSGWWGGE